MRGMGPTLLLVVGVGCGFRIEATGTTPGDAADATDAADAAPPDPACAATWTYTPSNFDPCAQGPVQPPLTLGPGMYTLVQATGVITQDGTPLVTVPTTGTSVVVVSIAGLTLGSGATLQVLGDRPTILSVHGSATIDGAIVVSARHTLAGAGAGACVAESGADATTVPSWSAGGGGAGAGFGTAGGAGGYGDTQTATKTPGGVAMLPTGTASLVPLRGGCQGGAGGQEDPRAGSDATPGPGGGGGGALQLAVRDAITLGASAELAANGGGGTRAVNVTPIVGGYHVGAGGGGGGSGGALLLEAATMAFSTNAILCANGGGGGAGSHQTEGTADGQNGACALSAAGGGVGVNDGGAGAFEGTAAAPGANGHKQDDGGGGGGGGVGRIRIRTISATKPTGFRSTPAALVE